ncbi:hypothetical protein [Ureibacillus sp. GCM10028918]|uniref:hypothetical protein n=1 Tax=Ureibacillus sp. GCM10028918 TaxID=3273429 RepID=UPI003621A937
MLDTLGDIFGIVVAVAVFCFLIYFVIFVIVRTISSILYFFKWRKMTPAERAYEKRIRNRYSSSGNSFDWWNFGSDSGGSADGGGGDGGGGD